MSEQSISSSLTVGIPEQLDSRETLEFLEFIPEKASQLWQGWQDMRRSGRPISFLDAMLEDVKRKPDAVKEEDDCSLDSVFPKHSSAG